MSNDRPDVRRVLLAATAIVPVLPLMRVPLGDVPIYVGDVVLLGLAVAFLRPYQLRPGSRAVLGWGLAFVVSTVPSVVIALLSYDEPLFTTYYYGRRLLALVTFGTFLVLFSSEPTLRRLAVHALLAGLVLTSLWCVVQVLSRSTGPIGALDRFYYVVLGQAVKDLPIDRWEAAWKVPRAIAGWWNPNNTGAALVLLLCLVPAARQGRSTALVTAGAGLALLTTASRQSLMAAAVTVGAFLLSPRVRAAAGRVDRRAVLFAVVVAAGLGLALAGDQLARLRGAVEGSIGEGFSSRLDNYPAFWEGVLGSSPLIVLFGRGAEGWAVFGRTGGPPDAGAFVSNTLLLTLAENGLVSVLLLLAFLVAVFRRARTPWQRSIVVVAVWLLNCDNHLYLFPALTALLAVSLALAAAPPQEAVA